MKGEIKMVDQNCAYCVEGDLVAKFLKSRAIQEEL